jgi:SAM-dependent methyltransferase
MTPKDTLFGWWERELTERVEGWGFSALDGRMREDEPPWDLDSVCRAEIGRSRHVLDMGTGGGEQLLRFADVLPSDTVATEGWPPNVPVARRNLEPHGIPVVDWDADRRPAVPMPFGDGRFDLVVNRHESYGVPEVARVLLPGGVFLTQQVGSDDARETAQWFGGTSTRRSDWTLGRGRTEVEAGGLVVERAEEWCGTYELADVAALMRYFSIVPWDLPEGFTVTGQRGALLRLHERTQRGEPLRLTKSRWMILAQKP